MNNEHIRRFLMEERKLIIEAAETGNPEVDAILDNPWTKEGENKLGTLNVPGWVIDKYRKGSYRKEKEFWEETADHWGMSERDLSHLILGLASIVPGVGIPAALYDSLLYYDDYERTKDPWKLVWAGLALLAVIPGGIAVLGAAKAGMMTKVLRFLNKPGVVSTQAKMFAKMGPKGEKISNAMIAFQEGKLGTMSKMPGITSKGKAVAVARAEKAIKASKEVKAAGAAGRETAIAGGAGIGAAMKAGKIAEVAKIAEMTAAVEKSMARVAVNSKLLTRLITNGKSAGSIAMVERKLVITMAKSGFTRAQINAALKAAGSTSKIKNVMKGTLKLADDAVAKIGAGGGEAFAQMYKMMEKAPGVKREALEALFKYKYSGVQALGKGKLARSVPILRLSYPIYTFFAADGSEQKIHGVPPIVPDSVDPNKKDPTGGKPPPVPRRTKCSDKLLKKGCRGANVKALQRSLMKLGFSVGSKKDDGKFGPETERGVKDFQKEAFPDNSKEWDGVAGPKTLDAIANRTNRVASGGDERSHAEEKPCPAGQIRDPETHKCVGTVPMAGSETNMKTDPSGLQGRAQQSIMDLKKESNINKTLANHKEQVLNERLEKLIKGLV